MIPMIFFQKKIEDHLVYIYNHPIFVVSITKKRKQNVVLFVFVSIFFVASLYMLSLLTEKIKLKNRIFPLHESYPKKEGYEVIQSNIELEY
jgi:cell division protein FtsW (lipid II flippase)